jgi:anti-sigma factor RsiW
MIPPGGPSEQQIHDYIDGRLGGRDLMAVAAYLRAHPEVASEVENLRRQNEALKRIGQEVLDEPVPERLRALVRGSARSGGNGGEPKSVRGFLRVVVAILAVCIGTPADGHDGRAPPPGAQALTTAAVVHVSWS